MLQQRIRTIIAIVAIDRAVINVDELIAKEFAIEKVRGRNNRGE